MNPKIINYYAQPRGIGRSLYVLIPNMIKKFMNLQAGDELIMRYDAKTKKISIGKGGGNGS